MAPSKNRHIEIIIDHDDDLRKKFLMSPNALHRAERDVELGVDYRKMTMRARCMLAALLTMSSGHRCDRAAIEEIAWELGDDALDGVLWELRSRGHLRIRQVNGDGGKFTYTWGVSRRGRPDWAEQEEMERATRSRRARLVSISAGQAMGGKSGHGSDSDDSDETMGGSPGHGEPPLGEPGLGEPPSGQRGSYKEEEGPPSEKDQREEKPPPPSTTPDEPAAAASGATPLEAEGAGGEQFSQEQEDRAAAVLDAILDTTHVPAARRPRGSKRRALTTHLATRAAAGWTDADLVDYLAADRFAGVASVYAVLAARIGDLGDPPPLAPPAPPLAPPRPPAKPKDDGKEAALLAGERLTAKDARAVAMAAATRKDPGRPRRTAAAS